MGYQQGNGGKLVKKGPVNARAFLQIYKRVGRKNIHVWHGTYCSKWTPAHEVTYLDELNLKTLNLVDRRRRMAQREFSSRRDSPVMVRLLEEIVAAQNK